MSALERIYLHHFEQDISGIDLPEKFTYPFCYDPHPLSVAAVQQVQKYLGLQQDFEHNFGLGTDQQGLVIGKMFGVLVVKDRDGALGFVSGVSGKLGNSNVHRYFVPPVYDLLNPLGFFLTEEQTINRLNAEIDHLEKAAILGELTKELQRLQEESQQALQLLRTAHKLDKTNRKKLREKLLPEGKDPVHDEIRTDLIKQSYRDQHIYARTRTTYQQQIQETQQYLAVEKNKIATLKEERRQRSADLQTRIFAEYHFLNAQGITKDLRQIFEKTSQKTPPAGAGECAAPKLLQYAYLHQLAPVCMAEFWWGASPGSEVRKHGRYYPSCRGKCEPILSHMLEGLDVTPNPMAVIQKVSEDLHIIYEDEDIIVVNKSPEFLSVPGIQVKDSVHTRIQEMRPEITGPVIIHRLDMSTSGILVLAKHKDAHQFIQDQFIRKTVQKRYTALLEGILRDDSGTIDLPLRVDLDDRPRQIVCYVHGKPALTNYKVVAHESGKTRVHFFPVTGRTHQLRVHAAHHAGLGIPILGDDLYGTKSDRLHLHAGYISLIHPKHKKLIEFTIPDPF